MNSATNSIIRLEESSESVIPRGSYPTPFLGYLVLWLGSPIWKSRYLKKGVGYEPIGIGGPDALRGVSDNKAPIMPKP